MSYLSNNPNQPQADFKRHMIFMVVIFIGAFLWLQYSAMNAPEKPINPAANTDTALAVAHAKTPDTTVVPVAPTVQTVELKPDFTLENHLADYTVDPNTGALKEAILRDFLSVDSKLPVHLFRGLDTFGAVMPTIVPSGLLNGISVERASDSQAVVTRHFRSPVHGGSDITYTVTQTIEALGGYRLRSSFKITNTSAFPIAMSSLTVSTGGIQPELQLSADQIYTPVHSVAGYTTDKSTLTVASDAKDVDFAPAFMGRSFRWFLAQNKYCTSIVKTEEQPFDSAEPQRIKRYDNVRKVDYVAIGVKGTWNFPGVLAPNDTVERALTLYTGPKHLDSIAEFEPDAVGALQLSYFSWFEALARWTMKLLFLIHDYICPNYGIAIILLTLALRLLFWPLQNKSTESMAKMQAVQPKMKALQEQYKDNPQVLNQKIMELYRTEGVNPMGGCLPMLAQLPVFIALFAALNGAVELRGVPFLWIESLTRPDTIAHIFGLPINPLILAQTVLMVFQQKLMPSSGDAMQKRMMYLMPIMILVFFYNMPAGLTLYMTVSSIPQLIQQWFKYKKLKQQKTA